MGMYDTIIVQDWRLLPEEPESYVDFCWPDDYQTKDLGRSLDTFLIRRRFNGRGELVQVHPGDWKDEYEPTGFTGTIEFHSNLSPEYTGWISFKAYFAFGDLKGPIRIAEYRPIDPFVEDHRRVKNIEWWLEPDIVLYDI